MVERPAWPGRHCRVRATCDNSHAGSANAARKEMHDAVQAHRLTEIRKAHGHARQADVAATMGVSHARVSKLETGDLSHTKLGTLQSYVAALGGNLRIVADFGEPTEKSWRRCGRMIQRVSLGGRSA
jgi:predicted XRE-type DNA-binding protein